MKQYLLAVHLDGGDTARPDAETQQAYQAVDAFNAELRAAGNWVFAGGLHPPATATVVRARDGQVVTTDGPFAETKEQLGGFWVIHPRDLLRRIGRPGQAAAAYDAAIARTANGAGRSFLQQRRDSV